MTTQADTDITQRFADAMAQGNQGDFGPWMDLFTDDAVWHAAGRNRFNGDHRGHAEIRQWFESMVALGLRAQPLDVLVDDSHFVVFLQITGERDGKTLSQVHADAYRMQDGQFCEGFFLPDDQAEWDAFLS